LSAKTFCWRSDLSPIIKHSNIASRAISLAISAAERHKSLVRTPIIKKFNKFRVERFLFKGFSSTAPSWQPGRQDTYHRLPWAQQAAQIGKRWRAVAICTSYLVCPKYVVYCTWFGCSHNTRGTSRIWRRDICIAGKYCTDHTVSASLC